MTENEFSRPMSVTELTGRERHPVDISAEIDERAALARRFGLEAIGRLNGSFRLSRSSTGEVVTVHGQLTARVTQLCVIGLEPFEAPVELTFERRFQDQGSLTADTAEVEIDPEGDDPPDPIIGGILDLGEILAEELGLALDPHPRKPGVSFSQSADPASDGQGRETAGHRDSPFAALLSLRARMEDE